MRICKILMNLVKTIVMSIEGVVFRNQFLQRTRETIRLSNNYGGSTAYDDLRRSHFERKADVNFIITQGEWSREEHARQMPSPATFFRVPFLLARTKCTFQIDIMPLRRSTLKTTSHAPAIAHKNQTVPNQDIGQTNTKANTLYTSTSVNSADM